MEHLSKSQLISLVDKLASEIGDGSDKIKNDFITSISQLRGDRESKKDSKPAKAFSMAKYRQRQIALQIQYDGAPYFGFASQSGECEETVEKHLFDALLKLRLIESRSTCNYSRCGRTDRGVSAFGQVVSLRLRSSFAKDLDDSKLPRHPSDKIEMDGKDKAVGEMDYCGMINRCLPDSIRVISWAAVSEEFNARFSASFRTYRYFFVGEGLNIAAMEKAASFLVGDHDFSNFCKQDIAHVSNFHREIYFARINSFLHFHSSQKESDNDYNSNNNNSNHTIYYLEISGVAFLWHMVRCIMAILFLVGKEQEQPDIVTHLFNVDNLDAKPQYTMAPEQPLLLYQCGFDNLELFCQPEALWSLTAHFQALYHKHLISAAQAKTALEWIENSDIRAQDSLLFVHEMLDKYDKLDDHQDSLVSSQSQDEDNNKDNSNDQDDVSIGAQRKRSRVDNSFDTKKLLKWSSVVEKLHEEGIYPEDAGSQKKYRYVSLLERQRGEKYEDRVAKLSGKRKERHQRHIDLQAEGKNRDTEFFAKMRTHGNV